MTRRTPWVVMAAFVMLAVAPRAASAQMTIIGFGGVTNAADAHPFGGGGLAGRAGPIEIAGEVGRFSNILPKGLAATATELSGGLVKAELPAWYGMGTVRLIASSGPLAPYLVAGAGVARLTPRVTVGTSGSVQAVFGDDEPTDKFMIGLGGGLRIGLGRAFIDGGYRYVRVFQEYRSDANFNNDDVLVKVHVVQIGVGIRF